LTEGTRLEKSKEGESPLKSSKFEPKNLAGFNNSLVQAGKKLSRVAGVFIIF
jgi:hypothetical protein